MKKSPIARNGAAALILLLLAAAQLFLFIRRENTEGEWFLYGRDTVFQDALQILWVKNQLAHDPQTVPLWIAEVQGGIPTIGSFFWTPFSPHFLFYYFMDFPAAQKLAWLTTLWVAGLGAWVLGRACALRWWPRLFLALAWMLCGHLVTLIHAGHFQKVVALSWLPWAAAGAMMVMHRNRVETRRAGAAILALAIGMMLLGGHPQIAYAALIMVGGWVLWCAVIRRRVRRILLRFLPLPAVAIATGLAISGAQLLPGLEMSAVSNRAAGVSFEEATATSYPPGELMELLSPRWKGSSVFGDVYTGQWGERIVSDYAGKVVVLLAFLGILGAGVRGKIALFWILAVLLSLLIGLGRHTPVHEFLYNWLPGFASFRSPGTFMAVAALGIAVLGGLGMQVVLEALKKRPRAIVPICAVLLLLATADLMRANRHFLFAHSWEDFNRALLAPGDLDVHLAGTNEALEVHDVVSELNLRPILYGRRAINGYYPIHFGIKSEMDQALGYGTAAWFEAWGITHLTVPTGSEPLPPARTVARFPRQGRDLISLGTTRPFVSIDETAPEETEWSYRRANGRLLFVKAPPGTLEIAEIMAPGWELWSGGSLMKPFTEVQPLTEINHAGGGAEYRLIYRPRSWHVGVYASGVGLLLFGFFAGGALRRPRAQLSPPDDEKPRA